MGRFKIHTCTESKWIIDSLGKLGVMNMLRLNPNYGGVDVCSLGFPGQFKLVPVASSQPNSVVIFGGLSQRNAERPLHCNARK